MFSSYKLARRVISVTAQKVEISEKIELSSIRFPEKT